MCHFHVFISLVIFKHAQWNAVQSLTLFQQPTIKLTSSSPLSSLHFLHLHADITQLSKMQLWCHFSIESLMDFCFILSKVQITHHSNMFSQPLLTIFSDSSIPSLPPSFTNSTYNMLTPYNVPKTSFFQLLHSFAPNDTFHLYAFAHSLHTQNASYLLIVLIVNVQHK